MKKKEIARHLDAIIDSIHKSHVCLRTIDDKCGKELPISNDEIDAIKEGIITGLAFAALLCDGEAEPSVNVHEDAAHMVSVAIAMIVKAKEDEDHE